VTQKLSNTPLSSCILKQYFRELPESIVTHQLYGAFIRAGCIVDESERAQVYDGTDVQPRANRGYETNGYKATAVWIEVGTTKFAFFSSVETKCTGPGNFGAMKAIFHQISCHFFHSKNLRGLYIERFC
jgi:hypothetical protein